MNKKELNITEYSLTFKEVTCIGVDWEKKVFILLINGIEYIHEQKEAFSCSADTDHIRCAIDEFIEAKKEELFKNEFFSQTSNTRYRVLFFVNENNEIFSHMLVSPDWSNEILAEKITAYNKANASNNKSVFFKWFTEGSYTDYLFKTMDKKKKYDKELLQEALNAIEQVRDCICSLENIEE